MPPHIVSHYPDFFKHKVTICRLRGTAFRGTERLRNVDTVVNAMISNTLYKWFEKANLQLII